MLWARPGLGKSDSVPRQEMSLWLKLTRCLQPVHEGNHIQEMIWKSKWRGPARKGWHLKPNMVEEGPKSNPRKG